jgi:hypothetical protein
LLLAAVLGAGCSVRADLGGSGHRDAAPAEALRDLAPESTFEALPEARPEVATRCDDNLLDGDETDVDCGGSCAGCGLGQRCQVTADCGTWPGCDPLLGCACDAQKQTCVYNHCADYRQDFGETAIDCGGGECAGCGPNKACVLDSDCSRTLPGCDANRGGCACDLPTQTCVYSHCYDRKNDADETGVDCGGSCRPCAQGVACQFDGDCTTQACDAKSLTCVSNQCIDHHQNGDETDVDCGGGTCGPCIDGLKCKFNSDCVNGFCSGGAPHTCN